MFSYPERSHFIKRLILAAVIAGSLLALLIPTVVHGQGSPVNPCEALGGCLNGTSSFANQDAKTGVSSLILTIVYFLIYISAAVSVLFIVFGGYTMIVSDGNGDSYKKGVTIVRNAVIGLVVAIASLAIVTIVVKVVPSLDLSSTSNTNSGSVSSNSNSGTSSSQCTVYAGGAACGSAYQQCIQNQGGSTCDGRSTTAP